MKTFYFYSGRSCVRTASDCQRIYDYFIANGFRFIEDFSRADVLIIGSCGYTNFAERVTIKSINYYLKYKQKNGMLICIGCLPSINRNCFRNIEDCYNFSWNELDKLDTLIKAKSKIGSIPRKVKIEYARPENKEIDLSPEKNIFYKQSLSYTPSTQDDDYIPSKAISKKNKVNIGIKSYLRETAQEVLHLRVAEGCLGSCTYCVIRHAKGKIKSRFLNEILKDFKICLGEKSEIIFLEADDLGCYGLDINIRVVELLHAIFKIKKDYKLILSDFNPQWFIRYYSDLIKVFTENYNRIFYLHIPVESGSNRILKLMKRPYRIEDLKETLFDLKSKIPSLEIWCNFIVGFPGETEENFAMTKKFVKELKAFKLVYPWATPYADRSNSSAFKMKGKVNAKTIRRRILEFDEIAKRS